MSAPTSGPVQLKHTRLETFSGPLPPPDLLEHYERAMPGAAERIFALTERQSTHRHTLESTVVRGNVAAQTRGQWMGFIVAILAVAGGVWLLSMGKSIEGYSAMFGPLTGLAGIFIWSRRKQDQERSGKMREMGRHQAGGDPPD